MKKVLLASMLLFSATAFAQNGDGAQRRCGNDFAPYGLAGMTYAQVLDYVGQTHNDYQDYLLRELAAVKMDFTDTVALKRVVSEKSVQFFAPKGISFDPAVATLGLAKSTDFTFPISPKSYSPAAYEIIMALQELLRGYDANNEAAFFAQLAKLRADALNLPNETEVFVAGLPVTIAMYSFTYWKSNGQYWMDLLTPYNGTAGKMPLPSGEALREKTKCKISMVALGGSDVAGGVNGAIGGSVLGPGGSLAVGVAGAAGSSLMNLGGQLIKCWWPF